MMFLEYMRDLLEQGVKGNPGFIIAFLGHLEQFFEIFDLKNALINDVPEKTLGLLDKLNVAIDQINFFENLFFLYPFDLEVKK
jgi:hypothetical protein